MLFDSTDLADRFLAKEASIDFDALDFGVIGINDDDEVVVYNKAEVDFAGLTTDTVIGQDLFEEVAPCMNNFLVSQRLEDEDEIDDTIDYVLTLKMKPTKVKIRLLKRGDVDTRYILIQRN